MAPVDKRKLVNHLLGVLFRGLPSLSSISVRLLSQVSVHRACASQRSENRIGRFRGALLFVVLASAADVRRKDSLCVGRA